MKKNGMRALSAIMAAAMLVTLGGCAGKTATEGTEEQTPIVADSAAQVLAATGDALAKEETVYVLCGADGGVSKVIVSDWIQNGTEEGTVKDSSTLDDVTVVKGDTTYSMDGANGKVWDAKGGDVYYQGTTAADLPVSVQVSYQLDGKSVTAQELAGKSGKVTIRFDYTNTQYQMVDIDGKQTKIYVPFAMLTGMMLDNAVFQNVQVTNGKLIYTGDSTVVLGVALPGMQENLNCTDEQLDLPDCVEITADVTNFSMTNTLTLATNELFNDVDLSEVDGLDDLEASLGKLTDAMDQLLDGSSKLYENLDLLLEKSQTLVSGIGQIAAAVDKLDSSTEQVYDGAKTLGENLATLQGGLGQLSENSATLNAGAKQVFQTLLDTANTQLKASGLSVETLTVENYDQVLTKTLAGLDSAAIRGMAQDEARRQVSAAVHEQEGMIRTKVTAAVQQQVQQKVVAGLAQTTGQTAETVQSLYDSGNAQIKAMVDALVSEGMNSDESKAAIEANTQEQINSAISENLNSAAVQAQINDAVEQAKAGQTALAALKEQLDSYNTFYQGLLTYTGGVDTAYAGSQKLTDGAGTLAGYIQQISQGLTTLNGAMQEVTTQVSALPDGVSQLADGAMQLHDGLQQLNEQGIQKLTQMADGDLAGMVARLRATVDVSREYNNFSGISADMAGSVKFVYRTDSVGESD